MAAVTPKHHAGVETAMDSQASPISDAGTIPHKIEDAKEALRPKLVDQTSRLPKAKMVVVFLVLCLAMFITFLDQTATSTATPVLADALGAGESISWVGASFLITMTPSSMLYGRMSDIFGRTQVLTFAILVMCGGNILAGFARSPLWLYLARAIVGIGSSGINCMTMVITSDLVSLKERGNYQGMLGAAVALGSGLGPLAGGGLAQKNWRWVFWLTVPMLVLSAVLVQIALPLKKVGGDIGKKVRTVDFGGSFLILASVVLVLVSLSGAGAEFSWVSAKFLAMCIVGSLVGVAFIFYEYKVAKLPILPMHIFRSLNVSLISFQSVMIGAGYYGSIFYLPLYYQNILRMSPFKSGLYLLPMILTEVFWSIICGQYSKYTGRVVPAIVFGTTLWTIGTGLQYTFGEHVPKDHLIGFLFIQGVGYGCVIQTTLVAAQASVSPIDRSVVTSARNLFRMMGGAIGTTLFGAILSNVFLHKLSKIHSLSETVRKQITTGGLTNLNKLGLDARSEQQLVSAYMAAMHAVFIVAIPVVALTAVCSYFMENVKLHGDDDALKERLRLEKEKEKDSKRELSEKV